MTTSTGNPEEVCVAVWDGVCVTVRVSVGVCVWVCVGVPLPLGVAVALGLCDCVPVGEQIRFTAEARRPGKGRVAAHVAPASWLTHAPSGFAPAARGAAPAPTALQ